MKDPIQEHDPWITLALAIVYQAAVDAENGHPALATDAKLWLEYIGLYWCEMLNVPINILENWSSSDFRLIGVPQRNWRY